MATVISYQRFSSSAQRDSDSIRRQDDFLGSWLRRHPEHKLDDTLRDKAVSGFRGRNASRGALSDFLRAIEAKRIKRGTILLVENMDRLSRQPLDETYQLVRRILLAGVRLITPEIELERKDLNDLGRVMMLAVSAFRAHQESQRKSEFSSANWKRKREEAQQGKPTGRICPSWLHLKSEKKGGKYVIVPEKAAVVRRLFKMAAEGHGITSIARTLNGEGVPALRGRHWGLSAVARLLHSRAVLGEWAPCRYIEGKSVPTGEIVEDYYPALVSQELWHRVQQALDGRRTRRTYIGAKNDNPFAGLLVAKNGSKWTLTRKGAHGRVNDRLVCFSDIQGRTKYGSIDWFKFREMLLFCIMHWDKGDDGEDDSESRLEAVRGEIEIVKSRLERLQDCLQVDDDLDTLLSAVRSLERKRKELEGQAERIEQERAALAHGGIERAKKVLEKGDSRTFRQVCADVIERIELDTEHVGRRVHWYGKVVPRGGGTPVEFESKEWLRLLYGEGLPKMPREQWEKLKAGAKKKGGRSRP